MSLNSEEIAKGQRFRFGENWSRFLQVLDQSRIEEAQLSLTNMLGLSALQGRRFLDVGSGSGLFSLGAHMLGAQVTSFDFDPQSVACARELRSKYAEESPDWIIDEGSVLDADFLSELGTFDVVYSWGVLHHTGRMWSALSNIIPLVRSGGVVFVSIYNDQGGASRRWRLVKKFFCSGLLGRLIVKAIFYPYFGLGRVISSLRNIENPWAGFAKYKRNRGMSVIHDWNDWLGGYPFEVAKPEEVFQFFSSNGFVLRRLRTCGGGLGCNEFVFLKQSI